MSRYKIKIILIINGTVETENKDVFIFKPSSFLGSGFYSPTESTLIRLF